MNSENANLENKVLKKDKRSKKVPQSSVKPSEHKNKGTVADCDVWVTSLFEKPDHIHTLLFQINEMTEDVRKLREDVENGLIKRDVGVARNAQMQREIRGNIAQVEEFTTMKDRKGLLLAGADRAIRELLAIFKDDPISIPLEEASMAVWARMQLEE
jgi:signal recognition particle GTPase